MTKNPIYCAIDTSSIDDALRIIDEIHLHIGGIKLGLEFFTSCGLNGIERIQKLNIPLFLDLKLYDIPNTVKKIIRKYSLFKTGIYYHTRVRWKKNAARMCKPQE